MGLPENEEKKNIDNTPVDRLNAGLGLLWILGASAACMGVVVGFHLLANRLLGR